MVTFAGSLLFFGDPIRAFFCACGSTLPDMIEFLFPLPHRGVSHSLILWSLVFSASCCLVEGVSYTGVWEDFRKGLSFTVFPFLTGGLFHCIEDAFSRTGVPFLKGRRVVLKIPVYSTGSVQEDLLAVLVSALCILVYFCA